MIKMRSDKFVWLLVDIHFGLMDGFYTGTYSRKWANEACARLTKRYPGSHFIPTKTLASPDGGYISNFCMHHSVSHIDPQLWAQAMSMRELAVSEQHKLAETALLGCLLIAPESINQMPGLRDSHFRNQLNRQIFQCMAHNILNNGGLCVAELVAALKSQGVYRATDTLAAIAKKVPSVSHAPHYFAIVSATHDMQRVMDELKNTLATTNHA